MLRLFSICCILATATSCIKSDEFPASQYACRSELESSTASPDDAQAYADLLQSITASGIPGISMAIYHGDSLHWAGAAGYADLANDVPFQPCNITRVGSTIKTFTAVVIMQLRDEGLLSLDHPIAQYLSGDYMDRIENADQATIRQLLNHSSGMYNYIQSLQFQTASINDLPKEWTPEELLSYAYDRNPAFGIGDDVSYSNTNYVLLGFLIEKLTGQTLYDAFRTRIFLPHGLAFSMFASPDPVPDDIVRGYVDLHSNFRITESTLYSGWDYNTADGGLISNPHDLALFLQLLFSGAILPQATLDEMLTFTAPNELPTDFYPLAYGLGIFSMETEYGTVYFHSGDAIGYYANMAYLPADGISVAWASNGNYGKLDEFISSQDAIRNILGVVTNP